MRGACFHPPTPDFPRVQVCILSSGVLQINCWPELPCPTCLWWLLLKKSLKISQYNIPRRDVTSASLPKLPSHCNTRPKCELSIWWFPGFNYAGADCVLGWLALQKQPSCPPPLSPNTTPCSVWMVIHGGWSSLSKPGLSDTHLRILFIAFCIEMLPDYKVWTSLWAQS